MIFTTVKSRKKAVRVTIPLKICIVEKILTNTPLKTRNNIARLV